MWIDTIVITGIWIIVVYAYYTFRTAERIEETLDDIRALLSRAINPRHDN